MSRYLTLFTSIISNFTFPITTITIYIQKNQEHVNLDWKTLNCPPVVYNKMLPILIEVLLFDLQILLLLTLPWTS